MAKYSILFHLFSRHAYQQKIDILKQEKTSADHKINLIESDLKSAQQSNSNLRKRLEKAEKQLQEVCFLDLSIEFYNGSYVDAVSPIKSIRCQFFVETYDRLSLADVK